jgi:hypothetical protein
VSGSVDELEREQQPEHDDEEEQRRWKREGEAGPSARAVCRLAGVKEAKSAPHLNLLLSRFRTRTRRQGLSMSSSESSSLSMTTRRSSGGGSERAKRVPVAPTTGVTQLRRRIRANLFTLRPYQQACVDAVLSEVRMRRRSWVTPVVGAA